MYETCGFYNNVSKILEDSVVLTTPNNDEVPGIFDSYIVDDLGDVIAAKYYFDKEEILGDIDPVEDYGLPLKVTGNISLKWWDTSFSGEGTLNIEI